MPLPLDGTEVELVGDPDGATRAQRRLTVHSRLPGLDLKSSTFQPHLVNSEKGGEVFCVIVTHGFEDNIRLYEKVTAV